MKKYNITVYRCEDNGNEKLHYTFNQAELDKLKKDVISIDYSGAYEMKNGDLVEVEEL